jgi:hypothetical protein
MIYIMSQSEVSRIRTQIELEYQSTNFVFNGFTPTARHEYITRKQENIAGYFEELQLHISPEEAMKLIKRCSEVQ